ncbi:lipopolysaccharide biosynthesis protein [Streptomyces sp. NPDC059853]|uniref:lipopolysaccharide biosynthesis protein n=1 Tax=Streptomyces sp. NPDC059853 TaxID=3346973 RepID=UPI00365F78D3
MARLRTARAARFRRSSRRTPALLRTTRTTWLPPVPPLPASARAGLRAVRARLPQPLPVWWPLLLCALAGTLGGAGYGLVADREYAASGYVVVREAEGTDPAAAVGTAQAFGRIATGDAVLTTAQADAGVTLAGLRGGVRAATSPDAPMIEITGTATSGARAAEMANAVARALIAYGNDAAESTGARLAVFADAQPSAAPVSSTPLVRTAVGLVAGLVVGLLVLLVRADGRGPAPAATVVPDQAPRTSRSPRTHRSLSSR